MKEDIGGHRINMVIGIFDWYCEKVNENTSDPVPRQESGLSCM